MARYTTELRSICETITGLTADVGLTDTYSVIDKAVPLIFSFDYPIFDNNYKTALEKKILKHYYFREIGLETYGKWKFFLDRKLNEIMPLYNQLYKSALLEFNPMYDVDLTRTHNRKEDETTNVNGTSENTSTSKATSETDIHQTTNSTTDGTSSNTRADAFSDTPQSSLTGVDNLTYLTNYRKISDNGTTGDTTDTATDSTNTANVNSNITDNGKTTNNTIANSLEEYSENVIGKQGTTSYSKLLQEFRETFLNIDMLVIDELSELFMGVY
jgi:hypothetical protein